MKNTIVIVLGMLVSVNAFAGGSISKADALEDICNESKAICAVAKRLHLDPVGTAERDRDGERFMPYEFGAREGGQEVTVIFSVEGGKLGVLIR